MNSQLETIEPQRGAEEIDFRAIIYDLVEYKWIVLGFALFTTLMGLTYVSMKAPRYQSDVLLQVESSHQVGSSLMSSALGSLGAGGPSPAVVQTALIQSRFILEPVVKSLGLDIVAVPKHHYLERVPLIGYFFRNKVQLQIKTLEVPHAYLNKPLTLKINKSGDFSLFSPAGTILVKGKAGNLEKSIDQYNQETVIKLAIENSPDDATFTVIKQSSSVVADKISTNLSTTDLGNNIGKSSDTGILQVTLKDTDPNRLIAILNTIAKVARQKDVERKSIEAAKTLDFLNQQLPLVEKSLEQAEYAFNIYRAKSGKVDIKLQTQLLLAQLTNIDKQIEVIAMNKASMLQFYTSQHPFYANVNKKEQTLKSERLSLEKQIKLLPASDQIAVSLMRDIKVKNTLYLLLLTRIQEMRVTKAGTVSDVRILSLANLPDNALPSGMGFIGVASFVLGLVLGYLVVVGRKAFFHRVEDPHWVERNLNLINLAIVPYSSHQCVNVNDIKGKTKVLPLLAQSAPHDLSIESLRSLRTSLQLMLCSARNNIVSIVGISPGVGKSFVSANFAYLLAETGKRVLLIDADLRRGYLQKYFQVSRAPGLAELIANTATEEHVIKATTQPNLMFLPVGNYPPNPSELLMNERFKNLLTQFSQQFDVVIIDTAPVLAVTDGVLVSVLAGINFLVLGSQVHRPEEIGVAIKRIVNAGGKVHGTIFNNLKPESKVYGQTRYNYHYKYENEETVASA